MRRKAYGRDFGLSSRMFLTMFALGALYVAFFVVMISVFDIGIIPMILILGGLAFLQYYTSDKVALAASGAKVVGPDEAPELHAMVDRLCAMSDLPSSSTNWFAASAKSIASASAFGIVRSSHTAYSASPA